MASMIELPRRPVPVYKRSEEIKSPLAKFTVSRESYTRINTEIYMLSRPSTRPHTASLPVPDPRLIPSPGPFAESLRSLSSPPPLAPRELSDTEPKSPARDLLEKPLERSDDSGGFRSFLGNGGAVRGSDLTSLLGPLASVAVEAMRMRLG
eukprot:1361465-Amorphochlora_amoeboformis.AAC.2